MSVANSVGQLSYGSFYLPALGFGYLSTQQENPLLQFIPYIEPFGIALEPVYLLYFLTGFSFLGALELHGLARAIYGPEGPSMRPKHKTVETRHVIAIMLNEDSENIPLAACRIIHNAPEEFLKYILAVSFPEMDDTGKYAVQEQYNPHPSRHRFETGVKQTLGMYELLSWGKAPRLIYFIPSAFPRKMAWISFISLVAFAILGTGSYVVFLLISAHIVLLFRGLFWSPIPNYVNPDGLEDTFVPEYRRREKERK